MGRRSGEEVGKYTGVGTGWRPNLQLCSLALVALGAGVGRINLGRQAGGLRLKIRRSRLPLTGALLSVLRSTGMDPCMDGRTPPNMRCI